MFPDGQHEPPPPSSDTILHWTIYATTQAGAIAHAHPHHAIALSYDRDVFTPEDLEGQLHIPEVPVVEQGPLQEQQIADVLRESRVALLRGHGAYARGGRSGTLSTGSPHLRRAPISPGCARPSRGNNLLRRGGAYCYVERRGKGSHRIVNMPNGQALSVPSTARVGTLRSSLRLAQCSVGEFMRHLRR